MELDRNQVVADFARNKKEIFKKILNKQIRIEDIKKSRFYKDIEGRVTALSLLPFLLDSNETIFKYNKERNCFSLIDADYLSSIFNLQTQSYTPNRTHALCETP